MKIQGLTIVHGDTTVFEVFITQDGAPLNITSALFWFTAKNAYTDADNVAVFQLTSPSGGISVIDAANGKIRVTIPASATSTVGYVSTVLVYDLQMKDVSANVSTITSGNLTVIPDVTRSTS
jgi:hypothetical protein